MTIHENEISRLFVLPPCQDMGFGTELLDFVERTILEKHARTVLDASLPAKELYLRRGDKDVDFQILPVKGNWIFGGRYERIHLCVGRKIGIDVGNIVCWIVKGYPDLSMLAAKLSINYRTRELNQQSVEYRMEEMILCSHQIKGV